MEEELLEEDKTFLIQAVREYEEDMEEIYVNMPKELESQCELMEVCCPETSRLTETFKRRGKGALRLGLPDDLSTRAGLEKGLQMMREKRPRMVWFSLPCGPYSPIQAMFNEKDEMAWWKSQMRKKKSRKLIRHGLIMAREQLRLGGDIAWEWPRLNGGWTLPEVRAFFLELDQRHLLHVARLDGCMVGVKAETGEAMKKPWTIKTTSPGLAMALSRRCCGDHDHVECLGHGRATQSGFYPQQMCDLIYREVCLQAPREQQVERDVLMAELYPVMDVPDKGLESLEQENKGLASCLRHRGVRKEVVQMATNYQCPDCQEMRLADVAPAVSLQREGVLWKTIVLDGAEIKYGDTVVHVIIILDEASKYAVAAGIFRRNAEESRNTTAEEMVKALETHWTMHYGLPSKVRLDPEGSYRSNLLLSWCEDRGIELMPCAAEAHEQIGEVESLIRKLKQDVRTVLNGQESVDPFGALTSVVAAHNTMERVQGFSPCQWVFGRQFTLSGRLFDDGMEDSIFGSQGTPGHSMQKNLQLRLRAESVYRKSQAQDKISRALNTRGRPQARFLPGDLVYYKRVKPPADSPANLMVSQKLWRWWGPARVLATETRTDLAGEERRPHNVVWIVTGARLKRCAPHQLRHASEREKAIADHVDSPVASWTFHSLLQGVESGQYDRFDNRMFPEDLEMRRFAKQHHLERRRSRTPSRQVGVASGVDSEEEDLYKSRKRGLAVPRTDAETRPLPSASAPKTPIRGHVEPSEVSQDEGAHPRGRLQQEQHQEAKDPKRPKRFETTVTVAQDRYRIEVEPLSQVEAEAMERGSGSTAAGETGELFGQPLFQAQQERLARPKVGRPRKPMPERPTLERGYVIENLNEEQDGGAILEATDPENVANGYFVELEMDMPENRKQWKLLQNAPEAFYVKKIRGAEVNVNQLTEQKKKEFDEAKEAEISQWLRNEAVRRASTEVDSARCIRMRWVLTLKETGKAKARIVLLGYEDPDAHTGTITSASPTMSRRTRQLLLQFKVCRSWRALKGDVKAAFLQGSASEAGRSLFARPLPELSRAMGLKEGECVQIMKSCYGLITAPASWYADVAATLEKAGLERLVTDPCCWRFCTSGVDCVKETQGLVCAHVDDFIVIGNEQCEAWMDAMHIFHDRYQWSDWEHGTFTHCGVVLRENEDLSVTLDHSKFVESLEPAIFEARDDDSPVTEKERSQLRGLLGALQWRCYNTAPQHAARLSLIQSEVNTATIATVKAMNKLLREVQQQRQISVKVNALHCPAEDVEFYGWCDAAVGNRKDYGSTGGYVIAATTPGMDKGENSPLTIVAWRSARLPRVARSPLGAELQAMSECEEELMFTRYQWGELLGMDIPPAEMTKALQAVKGTLVTDAKSLYDVVKRGDLNSAGAGLKEKYSTLEFLSLLERLKTGRTAVRWVHSDAQLADALTKPLAQGGSLDKVLCEHRWSVVFDPNYTSAKKRKGTEFKPKR
ncbi:unnamed protein product [Effrenium voratum]|nr:unnamed protein product [Effrenium voratum]